ncbi:hypothetical protein SAMN03097699_0683 [Flavobacteriaceae bacterium MAR_2010_188]|nr:hypothetical protein SAMN03097699_0683 [Flavobacteriaceae bacterium MAR_2010_188]
MGLDELKTSWDNSKAESRSQDEILKMTKLKNHPTLNRLRIKFVIETVMLIFFLLVFQDFFDAEKHSTMMNVLLAGAAILYIVNDSYGFYVLKNPIRGNNLKDSAQKFVKDIKILSITSISTALLFSIMVIVYFSSIVSFDSRRWILLGVFTFILVGMFIIMAKDWRGKISKIEEVDRELR